MSTPNGEKAPDLRKHCAQGGTQTAFPPPQTLDSRGNMRIPAQSGTGTARSEAEIVYFVHTPKRPAPSFAAASSPPNRRGAGLLCTRLSITRSPPFKPFMIPSAHHCTTGSAPSDADRGLTEPHETTEPRRRGRWWLPESRGPGASPGLPCSAV